MLPNLASINFSAFRYLGHPGESPKDHRSTRCYRRYILVPCLNSHVVEHLGEELILVGSKSLEDIK